MRKHIFGFALFALILGSAIFVYRLVQPFKVVQVAIPPPIFNESIPIVKPHGVASGIFTIDVTSVVADIKEKKVYAQIAEDFPILRGYTFAKTVIFAENSDQAVFQTEWLEAKFIRSVFTFDCGDCASMSHKTNYYARVYFADAPDDANLKLRLENEKSGDYYLRSTSVLVNSGKNK